MEQFEDRDLFSVLWNCILQADVQKVKSILLNGVDVDSFLSEDGHTALNLASKLSEEDCFNVSQVLLTQGANPNIQNKTGESSVHLAASRGYCKVLDLLLVNGGDPMLGDLKGQSPIDLAYKNGQNDALNLLNKVLDEENYEVAGYHNNKVVFSLLKEETVEILCNPDDEASAKIEETHSSDLVSQKSRELFNLSKWKMTCSNGTLQENCSDFSLLSMSRLLNSFCLETDLSNSKLSGLQKDIKSQYFDPLKGELANNTESDSDTDMLALQTYLRRNLLTTNDLGKSNNTSEYSDTVFESTYNDFNTAQSPLENLPSDEFNFELSYALRKEKNAKQEPLSNAYDEYLLKRDLNEISARNGNGVHYNHQKQQKSTYLDFDQSSLYLNDSQSESLSDTQYSLPSYLADVDTTAPLNTTKPECCDSFQLLKAPKKAKTENTYRKLTNVDDSQILYPKSLQCIKEGFEADAGSTETDKIEACDMSIWDIRCPSFNLHKAALKASCNETSCSDYSNSYLYEHREKMKSSFPKHMDKETNLETIHPDSVGSYGTGKSSASMGSTVKSFVGLMKEFLYEDLEEGVSFIERRCLASESYDSFRTTSSTLSSDTQVTARQVQQNIYTEAKPETGKADHSSSLGTLTDSVRNLRGEPLVKSLKEIGFTPGPILPNTERLYQRHLMRLRKNPDLLTQARDRAARYSHELKKALNDPAALSLATSNYMEQAMSSPFRQIDPCRHWRDGTNKTCFNYLLLDPRITQNLPIRGALMGEEERFKCFISSIFYIGKGTRCRPYYHLYEAFKSNKKEAQKSEKTKRIQSIWADDFGVVSLHVFQNTIPVEAWTREASMISAIGLQNLCNDIRGTFYGVASTWKAAEQRNLGTYLLYRSLNIFMLEGERQLRPSDISVPTWKKK